MFFFVVRELTVFQHPSGHKIGFQHEKRINRTEAAETYNFIMELKRG